MVYIDDENRGRLVWNEDDYPDHDGKYAKIRSMCNMSMLYCYADTFLMFEYPPKLLKELAAKDKEVREKAAAAVKDKEEKEKAEKSIRS